MIRALLSRHETYCRIILFLILTAAAAFRLYHINYDLPFLYDQDEPIYVTLALRMLKNHDLNPHWFGNPAGPLIYLLAFIYALFFLIGRGLGSFSSPEEFGRLYYSNPTNFYLSGRLVSVLFGIASVYLVYLIGRRFLNRTAGLVAAALLALSPIHITLSRMVRVDTLMTFLLLLAFWYMLSAMEKRDWRNYILAGFITGLATATKYPAIVFTLTIGVAHFLTIPLWRSSHHWKLIGCAASCIAGVFIGCPFLFLDLRTAIADIAHEARPEHLGATGEGFFQNLLWYLLGPLPNATSFLGLLLSGIGVVVCLTSKRRQYWALLSFPLVFLVFISTLNLRWERWIVPAVPFLCLLAGLGLAHLTGWIAKRFSRRVAFLTTGVVLLTVLTPLFMKSYQAVRAMSNPNTITLARQWLLDHVPLGSRILVETYGPQLPMDAFKIFVIDERGALTESKGPYWNCLPGWRIADLKNAGELAALKTEYFVMSGEYERLIAEKKNYASEIAMYEHLMSLGDLVFEVKATSMATRGPPIRIFRIR